MDNRRFIILFLLIFFLFMSPDTRPPSPLQEQEQQKKIVEEWRVLGLLNSSSYGDFDHGTNKSFPLAGLMEEEGFAWGLLPFAQDKARNNLFSMAQSAGLSLPMGPPGLNISQLVLPVYRNVTGKLQGGWLLSREEEPTPTSPRNSTLKGDEPYRGPLKPQRPAVGNYGRLFLTLDGDEGAYKTGNDVSIRAMKANLVIQSDVPSFGESWLLSMFGVHFPESGAIILSTTSDKFAGIGALPHFALSGDTFALSRDLLNKSLSDALLEPKGGSASLFPWSSLPHNSSMGLLPSSSCEFIVYLQQHPVILSEGIASNSVIETIENELRFPKGASIANPPPMVMSSVVLSPDCGFVLETNGSAVSPFLDVVYLSGPKQEQYSKYAGRFTTIVAGVFALQITLLMRQMKEASTPSTRSRVSFYTIAMMSMGDALLMSFILLELYSEASFLILIATSFLAFFSVSFLSMKFQIEIWVARSPPPNRNSDQTPTQATAATSTELPPPVTAQVPVGRQGPAPIRTSQPGGSTSGSDAGIMYGRFYFILFALLFVSSWSFFWPSRLRFIYANALSFIYTSFWTPQIYRNIMRNCRKALRWEFVAGESLLRLFPFLYFCAVPRNVLFLNVRSATVLALAAWVWIQGCVLVSQDILGPRFFVPKGWVPRAYDYHPILTDNLDDPSPPEDTQPEGTLPISALRAEQREVPATGGPDEAKAGVDSCKRIFDCAICMQSIKVPLVRMPAGGGGSGASAARNPTSLLSRRGYMVTPCQHIFHSMCLETWMRLRLQCPICREPIPPV